MKDPCEILGLEPNASEADIKKIYKELALKWHPDRHQDNKGDAEDKFKEIAAAYETLKNNNWKPPMEDFGQININIDDLFKRAFSSGPFGRRTHHRYEIRTGKILISMEEAFNGCIKKLDVGGNLECGTCQGSGVQFKPATPCQNCKGSGQIGSQVGAVRMITTCKKCRGFGKEIVASCTDCGGVGRKKVSKQITVSIPPGIAYGTVLTIEHNLNVIVLFKPHKDFILLENMMDIQSSVTIDIFTAMLGGDVIVKTISGDKNLKVKPTCQPGNMIRIRGAGMKDPFNNRGDHLIRINVKLPNKLTVEQKSLLKKLDTTLKGGEDGETN